MSEAEVLARVVDIVREVLDDDSIQLSTESLPADVEGWDSLAHVSIVVAIERAYKTRFTAQQIERLKTVGDLVRLVGAAVPS